MRKMKWVSTILLISLFFTSCGVQSLVETERDTGIEQQDSSNTENKIKEETVIIPMEDVGRYKNSCNVTVGDDGEFYFVDVQSDSCTVHIYNSEEQKMGMVTMKKGYDLFNMEVKQGRVLLFAHDNVQALLYHYVIETNIVEEYAIPWYETYIVYRDSIYFSNEEGYPMIIKTDFKGKVEKKIQLEEELHDFSMELIYRDRIYIQDLIGVNSIIEDGVIYTMKLDGSDWKRIELGKKFKGKYAWGLDASDGYVYMIITTDMVGDPCLLYRFATNGSDLELVAQSKKIDEFAIGKDNIFYLTNDDSTTIYSVNRKTGEETEFQQTGYAKGEALILMVSKDSLLTQKMGDVGKEENGSIVVVPQE